MFNISSYLNHLDWCIFLLVLALTIVIAFPKKNASQTSRKATSGLMQHMLMGRALTLPLFIGTLVATWYGNILGVTQIAFEHGIYNFLTQGIFWYGCYLLFALFLVKKIHLHQALSLPDLVHQMYGPKSAKLTAVLVFVKTLPIAYLLSLGFFIQWLTPLSLVPAMSIGLLFVLGYSYFGGFRAIVMTDALQCIVMCASVLCVVICSVAQYGGYSFLTSHLPPYYFQLNANFSWGYTLVWLWIAIAKTFVNPVFYQRCIAVPKPEIASKGIVYSVLIWFCFDCCTTLGGMYAKAVLSEATPAHAYLQFSLETLPNGLRGFFIAGMFATILSTLDSFLLISTHTLLSDFKLFNLSKFFQRKYVFCMLLSGIATLALATQFESVESTQRTMGSILTAVLLWPLLWQFVFPHTIKDKQFMLTALATTIFMLTIGNLTTLDVDLFYLGNLLSLALLTGFTLINRYFPSSTCKNTLTYSEGK